MPKLISEDSIILDKVIIHFLDLNMTEAVLSNKTTALDDDINDYLKSHIAKVYNCDDTKKCAFERDGFVKCGLENPDTDFVKFSQEIAARFFGVMQDAGTIPSGDLIETECRIGEESFFCALLMNYKTSFVHEFRSVADANAINFVKHHGILPGKAAKICNAFIINKDTMDVYVLEKKYEINGVKDFFISPSILGVTDSLSPKTQIETVRKVAEKVYEQHYGKTIDMKPSVAQAIYREINAADDFKMENIYDNFEERFPIAGSEIRQAMSAFPINPSETQPVPDTEYKKIARQVIKSSCGIEIKIPTKVYSNTNALEFIHNPDGSVSLLIKDIETGKNSSDDGNR